MKYALILCLCLTGCLFQTTDCKDLAWAQYNEICRRVGQENAQIWRLTSDHPAYTYHLQAKERRKGVWYWVPNNFYTVVLDKEPQGKCKPLNRIK